MALAFGDIVLVPFPLNDPSSTRRRPALVVSRENNRRPDVIVCFISADPAAGPDRAPLATLPGTGLKVPSVVRFETITTLAKPMLAGRLGAAPASWLEANAACFLGNFGFPALVA